MKKAFTMIELIFVIIILGILATIAIPKFAGVSQQAIISNGHSDVMAIRTAISTDRQKRLMQGNSAYATHLDSIVSATPPAGSTIFDGNGTSKILSYPIVTKSGSGGWMKTNTDEYTYYVNETSNVFTYYPSSGELNCTLGTFCTQLTK